jgi:hypothetical protein
MLHLMCSRLGRVLCLQCASWGIYSPPTTKRDIGEKLQKLLYRVVHRTVNNACQVRHQIVNSALAGYRFDCYR